MSIGAATAARNDIPPAERVLVSEDDAAVLLSVSKPTLRKYVALGLISRVEMPTGTRRNLYRVRDLESFAASLAADRDVVGCRCGHESHEA
jgi:hypothetical protein